MAELSFPRIGKIDKTFFDRVIYPRLGAERSEVLVGPRIGVDVAVVRVGTGQVLAVTTDPLSILPPLGLQDSAWLSVHLLASDLSTCGLPPAYAVVDFNLPPQMPAEDFQAYWEAMHREFARLGVAVVAGHTGRYAGCDYTVVGAGTLFAVGPEDSYVAAHMAQPGDRVILTKGAAIATTGLLARVFPRTIEKRLGAGFLARAQRWFYQFSVVEDALVAASAGVHDQGVTAMHDATEGGVLGALWELAMASDCGVRVRKGAIPLSEEAAKVCELFEIDPHFSLSEGSLLVTVRPHRAQRLLATLNDKGIQAAEVAEMLPRDRGLMLIDARGHESPLTHPGEDPYWQAYWQAVQRGWQ